LIIFGYISFGVRRCMSLDLAKFRQTLLHYTVQCITCKWHLCVQGFSFPQVTVSSWARNFSLCRGIFTFMCSSTGDSADESLCHLSSTLRDVEFSFSNPVSIASEPVNWMFNWMLRFCNRAACCFLVMYIDKMRSDKFARSIVADQTDSLV